MYHTLAIPPFFRPEGSPSVKMVIRLLLSDFPHLDCSTSSIIRQQLSSQPTQLNADLLNPNILKSYDWENEFDFNNFSYPPGMYRLPDMNLLKNPPDGPAYIGYGNVLVIRYGNSDTIAMIVSSYNTEGLYYRSENHNNWATKSWKMFSFTS